MCFKRNVLRVLLLLLLVVTPCYGDVYGPYEDYAPAYLTISTPWIPTGLEFCQVGSLCFIIPDELQISVTFPVWLVGNTYFVYNNGDLDFAIIDIYAVDTNPYGPLMEAGFNPTTPQMTPLSGETFFGVSNSYSATNLGPLTVGSLATTFPGFDLSVFSGADPAGIVYAYEADIPVSDARLCPEPSSLYLLGSGLLGFAGIVRRKLCRS